MRLRRLLRRQDGISLVLAVVVLGVLSLTATTLIYYANTNARSAEYSGDNEGAYVLAEAGINNAMAVLSKPENNALEPSLLPETTTTYENGTVTWKGTLDSVAAVWTLTSTGKIKNATGGTNDVTRTLTAKVPVTPTNTQPLNNQSWNYIMSTQVTGGTCDMTVASDVEIGTNLYVFGNLCLEQQAKVVKGNLNSVKLVVKGKLSQATSNNAVGTATAPIAEAHIVNGCKYWNQHWHPDPDGHPFCSVVDNVYATTLDSNAGTLVAPTPAWNDWWRNGSPGPNFACTTGGPVTFDNDAATTSAPNLSVTGTYNLTPSTSYSCWTAGGELSWNASTKVLTVQGTIFFDGHVRVDPTTANIVIDYNGQASIYAYGSVVVKNTKLCAAVSGSNCDFANWNPNTEMLAFVANGSGGQTDASTGESVKVVNAQFQGSVYGTNKVVFDTFSKVDGPMVGSEVSLGQSVDTDDFPNITTVPAGMPGNPTVYAQPNPPQLYAG